MAYGTTGISTSNVSSCNGAAHTPEELSDILEYEKIIQFRDSILAGTHPRVKIPAHHDTDSIILDLSSNSHAKTLSRPFSSNFTEIRPLLNEGQTFQSTTPRTNFHSSSRPVISNNSETNPILLENSDNNCDADILLQRKRLEKGLKEQVEYHRFAGKALLQTSELLPDVDISEALSIALAIVPPTATAENEPPITCRSPGSNSFDDNTFYSSQNDSPTPTTSPEGQKIASDQVLASGLNEWSSKENVKDIEHELVISRAPVQRDDNYTELDNRLNLSLHTSLKSNERHLESNNTHNVISYKDNFRESERPATTNLNSRESGYINFRKETNSLEHPVGRVSKLHQKSLRQDLNDEPLPTQIRNHDLPLVAPQPERVSPLPIASDSLILGALNGRKSAQVTALRHLSTFSSADSSPRIKSRERRREKKRRKVKDINTPNSPYIKAEPKSPSFHVPIPPPQKRQRGQYDSELNYERLRPISNIPPQERIIETSRWPHRYQDQGLPYEPVGYESQYRPNEGINTPQRISSALPMRRPQSPQFFTSHLPGGTRPRAISNLVGGNYLDDRDYASEPITRASVRSNIDRERTRTPPHYNTQTGSLRQYLVDEHSRPYLTSTPTPVVGHPIASSVRYRDEDLGHERVPTRTISSRIPMESYENESYLKRRDSPMYTSYRRVITEPEYPTSPLPNPRLSRQRGYSVYPTTASQHGEGKDPYRIAPDYQQASHLEESSMNYLRAGTMRPEPSRYETPREYITQMQYARPEPPSRGHDLRREILPLGLHEFSGPPVDSIPQSQWKRYSIDKYIDDYPKLVSHVDNTLSRQGSNYYHEPPTRRSFNDFDQERVGESSRYDDRYRKRPMENGIIESARLRESSDVYRADDPRGEMYR